MTYRCRVHLAGDYRCLPVGSAAHSVEADHQLEADKMFREKHNVPASVIVRVELLASPKGRQLDDWLLPL